jgi:SAM-dependent methyltransferase
MSSFADHFSTTAAAYAVFRPRYPAELFDWLASVAPNREIAWDCATGSGQAAIGLAERFARVVATDPSVAQLAHAETNPRVSYAAMTAERGALAGRSVALVTVAQALHWIDRPAFYQEARRTLVRGGVLAVWSYALGTFGEPAIDQAIAEFYGATVGPYWPPERAVVDEGYARIEFPFVEVAPPPLAMRAEWTFEQLAGYLSTWSAVRRAKTATGVDPLPRFLSALAPLWGAPNAVRTIAWPLAIRAGRSV